MIQRYTLAAVALCAVLLLPFQASARRGEDQAKPAKSSAAVVAIPLYIDATGSKDYGYMSGSVTEAVNVSMQKKFDYSRANEKLVEGETKKLWQLNKVPSDQEIRQIAASTQSDYVVVGSYSLTPNKKLVIFNARVFIAPDRFINTQPITNAPDATFFEATSRIATEIVNIIEADAVAQASARKEKVKEGEKIALSKTPDPAKTTPDDSETSRPTDRYLGVGVGYGTNTVERHTQFYQYSSPTLSINADLRVASVFLIYGKVALPQTPSGGLIPGTYKNNGNQTIGFEVGDRRGNYVFGMNYRNFSDVNPAGLYVRDLLKWSASAYMRTHYHMFSLGDFYFGLDLDSYIDVMAANAPNVTTNQTKLLWNLETAVNVSYFIPVVNTSLTGIVGAAYSLIDSTSQALTVTSGLPAWDNNNRNGIFTGVRLGLELEKHYKGVSFKIEGYTTPSVAGKFQPVDEQNAKRSSYAFAAFSAGYRFGF